MTWLVLGLAVVAVASLMRRELARWRDSGSASTTMATLRLITGSLLIVVFVLVAIGRTYVLPQPGAGGSPSPVMITYWLFIVLMIGVIVLLAVLDMFLVRRGYERGQDQALREVLLGQGDGAASPAEEDPGAEDRG